MMFTHLILISVILFGFVHCRSLVDDVNYAIIFDAGSKGTRLYLFKYSHFTRGGSLNVANLDYNFEQILYCELNDDGLGQYTSPNQIPEKFEKCMSEAGEMIPAHKKPTTFISLIATAGLRLLEVKNKELSDGLLQGVRDYFRSTSYLFADDSQVRMIDGWQEGAFSFLAANYLKKEFTLDSVNDNVYGVIDVGGASAQIAFVPKGTDLNSDYIHELTVEKNKYELYSHSYLCYGTAQILTMYSTKTVRDSAYSTTTLASCYPSGYDFKYTGEELMDQPCVNGLLFDSNYQFTLEKGRVRASDAFTVSGNSKKNKCRDEVRAMTADLKPCEFGVGLCAIDGTYQPRTHNNQYLALGNLFEAIDLTSRLYKRNLDRDMSAFSEVTYDLCSKTYKQLRDLNDQNGAGIGKNRIAKLCLENVYLMRYLELLGFDNLENIYATEYIDGKKVNWILGILIYELNNLNGQL